MLTINQLREDKAMLTERLKVKGFEAAGTIDKILALDDERKQAETALNEAQAEANKLAKSIGQLFKQGKKNEAESAKAKSGELKQKTKDLQARVGEIQEELQQLLPEIPNVPHELVVPGKSEDDNVEVRSGGEKPNLPGNKKPHWELANEFQLIDFELGNKITGAGFPVYTGAGAKLQRALINFFLDEGEKAGFQEVQPPILVNRDSAFATGQLPDKEGQMYEIQEDKLYPIPTAEVPVTNIYRDVILSEDDFPIRNMAYTPCFRREAGSYGKHVRGLNRLHQFDKVEIVQIAHPDKSWEALDEMVTYVEGLVRKLELPYRIMRLCGGDLGFTSAMTYDFEVYSAGQDRWLEVSSVSNFTTYQANRLKLRYKSKEDKRNHLAHTLNGSALALPRIYAALLENNQHEGYIALPKALHGFMGKEKIVK